MLAPDSATYDGAVDDAATERMLLKIISSAGPTP